MLNKIKNYFKDLYKSIIIFHKLKFISENLIVVNLTTNKNTMTIGGFLKKVDDLNDKLDSLRTDYDEMENRFRDFEAAMENSGLISFDGDINDMDEDVRKVLKRLGNFGNIE